MIFHSEEGKYRDCYQVFIPDNNFVKYENKESVKN